MRAIVLTADGPTLSENQSAPTPRDEEVIVRVLAAGICETDLQLIQGYMGFRGVLGHEFGGAAAGDPIEDPERCDITLITGEF